MKTWKPAPKPGAGGRGRNRGADAQNGLQPGENSHTQTWAGRAELERAGIRVFVRDVDVTDLVVALTLRDAPPPSSTPAPTGATEGEAEGSDGG